MTLEEAIRIVQETESDYTQSQMFLNGLIILSKYDDNIVPEFDHDVCWASSFEKTALLMTREDLVKMKQCGWNYDDDTECWKHY
jgi:hypothetical protein